MNILLAGCGKMGGALEQRWRERNLCSKIVIVDPHKPGAFASLADIPAGFSPDIILFAVKPQSLANIIGEYAQFKNALFISIAAGKTLAFFEQHLGATARIIRTMPNTPASIGQGITVACGNKHITPDDKNKAEKLLSAVGDFLWVEDEKLLNPVTALSGSGPAYVFLLIEAMTKAGIAIGLDAETAEKLARKTVTGSAALAQAEASISAATLRENVTSPGGTTAAALSVLMPQMEELFIKALQAATKRAEELAQ